MRRFRFPAMLAALAIVASACSGGNTGRELLKLYVTCHGIADLLSLATLWSSRS